MARNGRADWSRQRPLSGVLRPRLRCGVAAVHDRSRHFALTICCAAQYSPAICAESNPWAVDPVRRREVIALSASGAGK